MLDTTRIRRIGVGQHGRKNDAIDAEALAMALYEGRVPLAHVLSPERRALRAKLSIRGEPVDMRARRVVVIRGLVRATDKLLPSSSTSNFLDHVARAQLGDETRTLLAPLVATLSIAEAETGRIDAEIAKRVAEDPMTPRGQQPARPHPPFCSAAASLPPPRVFVGRSARTVKSSES